MSIHQGHLVGLFLIKEALAGKVLKGPTVPEGSDQGTRSVHEAFDSLPERDVMPDSLVDKTSAEAAFDANTELATERPSKDHPTRRSDPDTNKNTRSTEEVWREHNSYSTQSSEGPVIDQVAEPGPF